MYSQPWAGRYLDSVAWIINVGQAASCHLIGPKTMQCSTQQQHILSVGSLHKMRSCTSRLRGVDPDEVSHNNNWLQRGCQTGYTVSQNICSSYRKRCQVLLTHITAWLLMSAPYRTEPHCWYRPLHCSTARLLQHSLAQPLVCLAVKSTAQHNGKLCLRRRPNAQQTTCRLLFPKIRLVPC